MSSFLDLLQQVNDDNSPDDDDVAAEHGFSEEQFPLSDELVNLILMHRNVHFNGQFSEMMDYYQEEGLGVHPEIELSELIRLFRLQEKMNKDIAPLALLPFETEKVKKAVNAYKSLQKLCEVSQNEHSVPTLLADMILTEEEIPQKEINELITLGEKAKPYLIDLLVTNEFYDSLFPGYGRSPIHVAYILGKMKCEEAIIPLFENMKRDHFSFEESAIMALKNIGEKAFEFLEKVVKKKPITQENENAAAALMAFDENDRFASIALKLLQDNDILKNVTFAVHLILACAQLSKEEDKKLFLALKNKVPSMLAPDFQYVESKLS